jgi:DNA-binding NtrC family response regulator
MAHTILIVDDEKNTREGIELALEDQYDVFVAASADQAFRLMEAERFDLVLTDLRMAGKSGMRVIEHAMQLPNKPVCIMMTAYGSVETAVEAMRRGAYDFLIKPVSLEKLDLLIQRGLKSRHLQQENTALHQRLDRKFQFKQIVGNSPALVAVLDKVNLAAPSRATILLEGETGTGKELIAQAIHQNSPRARKPFVAVHCAALASNLLESELFGHEKGAFTGANERRIGRFEAADGGTLFLDEIGEIDAATQVKLLRFLESRSFERLGSSKTISVDVRLVCATNRNLVNQVKEALFREDLLYRLNVVTIHLPPLRARADDIPLLIQHYVAVFAKENGRDPIQFSEDAWRKLRAYSWPGNIRELRNFCENTVVLHRSEQVTAEALDPKFHAPTVTESSHSSAEIPTLRIQDHDRRLLKEALIKVNGNRTKAAALLGISRRTLHRKLVQWPDLESE